MLRWAVLTFLALLFNDFEKHLPLPCTHSAGVGASELPPKVLERGS